MIYETPQNSVAKFFSLYAETISHFVHPSDNDSESDYDSNDDPIVCKEHVAKKNEEKCENNICFKKDLQCTNFKYVLTLKNKYYENVCLNCNMSHKEHTQPQPCFEYKDNLYGYCQDCNHHITDHMYTLAFFNLDSKIKNKILDDVLFLMLETMKHKELKKFCDDVNEKMYNKNHIKLLKLQNEKKYFTLVAEL